MRVLLLLACSCGRIGFDSARAASDGDARNDGDVDTVVSVDARTICHTGTWSTPTKLGGTVTGSEEADPSISPDELTLYFESNRVPSMARAIFVATRTDRTVDFSTPTLVSELDTSADETEPSVSVDGLSIYYTSAQSGSNQIYTATRGDTLSPWTNVLQLPIAGDTTTHRGADLSADELTLYYTHDLDNAVATRPSKTDGFSFVRLLSEVNVPATDGDPSVTDDGLELFFDSYRTGSDGTILTASRTDTSQMFGAATDLAQLWQSIGGTGAVSPEISSDGRTLYFAAKDGTQYDLYTSTRTCN